MSKSNSIWYPRYVGDYRRKTSHLSLIEHGAYTLLLDHYYSTSKPLPANADQLHRICSAVAADEQAAVQSIITRFFTLVDGLYHNRKADDELLKRENISEKRRKAANEKYAKAPANGQQMEVQLDTHLQPQPHKEVSKKEVEVAPKRATRNQGSRMSADWMPSERNYADGRKLGLSDNRTRTAGDRFRDYWLAQAGARGVKADWDATFRNWLRSDLERDNARPGQSSGVRGGSSGFAANARAVMDAFQVEPGHNGSGGMGMEHPAEAGGRFRVIDGGADDLGEQLTPIASK